MCIKYQICLWNDVTFEVIFLITRISFVYLKVLFMIIRFKGLVREEVEVKIAKKFIFYVFYLNFLTE